MIRSRRRPLALAAALALAVTLVGCSFAPDPDEVHARASTAFDDLVAQMSDVDAAVLRTVEVLPESSQPCAEDGQEQAAFVARGIVSVRADANAVPTVLNDLADGIDAAWTPVTAGDDAARAWASEDGIVITMTDASPALVVAVFPPCA